MLLQSLAKTLIEQEICFPNQPLETPKSKVSSSYYETPIEIVFGKKVCNIVHQLIENESLNGKQINYNDISILCRNNPEVDSIAELLKSKNIPIEVIGGKGFYRSKEIIDTYRLLNAVLYADKETITELEFTDYYMAIKSTKSGLTINEFLKQINTVLRQSTVENALIFAFEK